MINCNFLRFPFMANKHFYYTSLFILLFISSFSFGQINPSRIDLDAESQEEFEILSDTLSKYQVYFTGENHRFATFNSEFQFKFLKYLHQNHDVNHFIFEQSPGLSYIINQIIIHDKQTHLHYLKDIFYGAFYDLVVDLQTYNKNLPDSSKIWVHGIDIERFPAFSIYALNEMVDTLSNRVEGGEVFEQIKALATSKAKREGPATFYTDQSKDFSFQFGEVSAWSSLKSIIIGAKENQKSLSVALGQDSSLFYAILDGMEVGQEWFMTEKMGDIKSPIIRERYMSDEFERVYKNDPTGKFYGQFGRCHLHKDQKARYCYDYYMNSIANRINDINPDLNNRVLVIPILYANSKRMDKEMIENMGFEERYLNTDESYIIDLAYLEGNHVIDGFYHDLPFVILSNAKADEDNYYDWGNRIEEIHLGAWIGNSYFNKISSLNFALADIGANSFDARMLTYGLSADYMILRESGQSFSFVYYPAISNGDRFQLSGFNVTFGGSYPVGNKYFLAAFGLDLGYGQMKLLEEQIGGDPNLIQIDNKNISVYRNDIFTIDPNVQFRLTLPVISLNAKAGYAFDASGKYWKLDGKAKDFTKTSFTAPYVMVGASLNFKNEE